MLGDAACRRRCGRRSRCPARRRPRGSPAGGPALRRAGPLRLGAAGAAGGGFLAGAVRASAVGVVEVDEAVAVVVEAVGAGRRRAARGRPVVVVAWGDGPLRRQRVGAGQADAERSRRPAKLARAMVSASLFLIPERPCPRSEHPSPGSADQATRSHGRPQRHAAAPQQGLNQRSAPCLQSGRISAEPDVLVKLLSTMTRARIRRAGGPAGAQRAGDRRARPGAARQPDARTNALAAAFGAREKAVEAQQAAMSALNLPSATDVERLERRLRSFSQRLEDGRGADRRPRPRDRRDPPRADAETGREAAKKAKD